MSTPDQPGTPALTRKQMREIRNTGSNPVITPETAMQAAADPEPAPEPAPAPPAAPPVAVAPLARAAEPVVVPAAPIADEAVDLEASPLTRRQARQQERIRTASVPVITPEVVAAHAAAAPAAAAPVIAPVTSLPPAPEQSLTNTGLHDLFGIPTSPAPVAAPVEREPAVVGGSAESPSWTSQAFERTPWQPEERETATDSGPFPIAVEEPEEERAVVSPLLGAGLLAGEPVQADLPPSFDQLLSRSTGSIATPNALILSQTPEGQLVGPVTATGEVLITGTFNLPEGLGSTGHAKGTTDGKEIDATLVDGELPSHSSPTPIAASAAISTVKTAGEVIRPPVPEKGSRLMMALAITAGALALALVGVLILAFATGVFS